MTTTHATFNAEEAMRIGNDLGVDWAKVDYEQFRMGLMTELEHGRVDPETDVTGNNAELTGKLVLAHLKKIPDYYTRLHAMEEAAVAYWYEQDQEQISGLYDMRAGAPGTVVSSYDWEWEWREAA